MIGWWVAFGDIEILRGFVGGGLIFGDLNKLKF